jgi:hypothetical protein
MLIFPLVNCNTVHSHNNTFEMYILETCVSVLLTVIQFTCFGNANKAL